MQSEMDMMELMAERLDVYVEREVALVGMHPSL